MIAVQTIVDRMKFVLDAEGSERYTFDQDLKPAINSSIEWLQAVFNRAFADKKLTEENLRELVKVVVFQTNQYSRVNLDLLNDSIWSIMKINPEPVLNNSSAAINPVASPEISVWRQDLSYLSSKYSAKRLSLEQWEESVDNIFEAGNSTLNNSFKSYAYLNFADYTSNSYNAGGSEIEIRPSIPSSFLSVTYLKDPREITLITENVELPKSLINLVYQKALSFVSYKQGDQTNLYSVTERDVATLVQQMI